MNPLKRLTLPQWLLLGVVFAVLLLAMTSFAHAAAQEPPVEVTAVKLFKGSTIIAASDPKHARYVADFTPEACRFLKNAEKERDAAARTSGQATYNCQVEERTIVTFIPHPTCAPPRAPETRQEACPNDPARTFTQTQTWTIAPHPTCESPTGWVPATPSATDCPPLVLAAPSGVTATAVSTSEIRVSWNVVPDALAYSLRRCIGASCDPMAFTALRCVQGLTQPHVTLGAGVTVRYQVQASRTADCTGDLSQPSLPVVSATTLTTTPPPPPPPPPPTACTGRVCTVSWAHDGPVADGFRVVYGTNANELVRVVQVTPGTVRTTQVTMPSAGIWHFGVKAYIGANESAVSNIRVHTIQ